MSDEEREIRLDAPEGGEGAEIAVGSGDEEEVAHVEIPETLPVLPLKNTVLFPFLLSPLLVKSSTSKKLIDEVLLAPGRMLLCAAVKRLDCNLLILKPCHHHNGSLRRCPVNVIECLEPPPVRKMEVK